MMGVGLDLPHDLAQYVVEAATAYPNGFWGLLAKGATFKSTGRRVTKPGRAVIVAHRGDLMASEHLAGRHLGAWKAGESSPVSTALDRALEQWQHLGPVSASGSSGPRPPAPSSSSDEVLPRVSARAVEPLGRADLDLDPATGSTRPLTDRVWTRLRRRRSAEDDGTADAGLDLGDAELAERPALTVVLVRVEEEHVEREPQPEPGEDPAEVVGDRLGDLVGACRPWPRPRSSWPGRRRRWAGRCAAR